MCRLIVALVDVPFSPQWDVLEIVAVFSILVKFGHFLSVMGLVLTSTTAVVCLASLVKVESK